MSKWINVSEVNNTLGKALESCKDELSSSFYGGARLVLDKINEMAEEVADTPQTATDFWASVTRDDCLKAHGLDADTPQTDEQFCIEHRCTYYYPQFGGCTKNAGDCPHIKDEPQTERRTNNDT